MLKVYSHFGFPEDHFSYEGEKKIKVIIDPPKNYFTDVLLNSDKDSFDVLILIHGCEPILLNNIEDEICKYSNFFTKIYTSSSKVLKSCENSEKFLFGGCWITCDKDKIFCSNEVNYKNNYTTNKSFSLSFIKSAKNFLPGHAFRHECTDIIKERREFDLIFPESIDWRKKWTLFNETMFHISIENSSTENYFSEKIIDCFMSYTIPIYWGCTNIGDYFNEKGIIKFNTKEELKHILDNLTPKDYQDRLPFIIENYELSKKYAFFYDRVNKILKSYL